MSLLIEVVVDGLREMAIWEGWEGNVDFRPYFFFLTLVVQYPLWPLVVKSVRCFHLLRLSPGCCTGPCVLLLWWIGAPFFRTSKPYPNQLSLVACALSGCSAFCPTQATATTDCPTPQLLPVHTFDSPHISRVLSSVPCHPPAMEVLGCYMHFNPSLSSASSHG